MDFLASICVAEFAQQLDDENLPLTHGVNWNEFGRNYRCFRLQGVEVDIFDLLDFPMDVDQVTLLTVLDYCNIIRNMSLHDTRRTNFVLSELMLWTKYLQCALQKMYEVAGDLDDEKETLKEDLAVAEAKLASNDTELAEAHEEVSRLQREQQLLRQEVADLNRSRQFTLRRSGKQIREPATSSELRLIVIGPRKPRSIALAGNWQYVSYPTLR